MSYRIPVGVVVLLAAAMPARAQDPEAMQVRRALEMQAQLPGTPGLRVAAVEARVTTGRPYSAEATTEFVQVLADGNRIARKTTVRIYRDSEGRTRREELGTGDVVESVSIYDPVARLSVVLDPKNRTALKSSPRVVTTTGAAYTIATPVEGAVTMTLRDRTGPGDKAATEELLKEAIETAGGGVGGRGRGAGPSMARVRMPAKSSTEPLGQQVFDGLNAEGTRTTTVIPAGEIGNQQEIRIVSEQWFSPDLQVLLMTRHSDPRSGETTYRLNNVIRADPGAALFEVPSDYTVKEPAEFRIKREPAQ